MVDVVIAISVILLFAVIVVLMGNRRLRDDVKRELSQLDKTVREEFHRNRVEAGESIGMLRDEVSKSLSELRMETELKLSQIRDTVELKLAKIQEDNANKLEKMRLVVEEKLEDTLNKRLVESFKQVSERLEEVHRGLGEMQALASDVGDLKKVLSNVKTRGILGEIQLGAILENILAPSQYEKDVRIKTGSGVVEYAIKLPGNDGGVVYLPIDSKFPLVSYQRLIDAYESGSPEDMKSSLSDLLGEIKKYAKSIRDKYISPPDTTDFGILFLPTEGLYAEVSRHPELLEALQREFRIVVTGPTTLSAFLNSLQMGFKTLAIEKRTSEVWLLLKAVKTEFNRFSSVLSRAQERINKVSEELDHLVGVRTRKIQSKLDQIQELPLNDAEKILDIHENPRNGGH